jgi:hypothetical protein
MEDGTAQGDVWVGSKWVRVRVGLERLRAKLASSMRRKRHARKVQHAV